MYTDFLKKICSQSKTQNLNRLIKMLDDSAKIIGNIFTSRSVYGTIVRSTNLEVVWKSAFFWNVASITIRILKTGQSLEIIAGKNEDQSWLTLKRTLLQKEIT